MKQEIELHELLSAFNTYLNSLGITAIQKWFDRDTVVGSLSRYFGGGFLLPPLSGDLTETETESVKLYIDMEYGRYSRWLTEADWYALTKDYKFVLQKYTEYLVTLGYEEFIVWAEEYYEDDQDDNETTRAFRLTSDENLKPFLEHLGFSRDIIVITPDMKNILILFHHHIYELYTQSAAEDFRQYLLKHG